MSQRAIIGERGLRAAIFTGNEMTDLLQNTSGGPVLTSVELHLIFWGKFWAKPAAPDANDGTATPASVDRVMTAVKRMFDGPYLSALSQYAHIGKGKVVMTPVLETADDPPAVVTTADIWTRVYDVITRGLLARPGPTSQFLYCVLVPPDVSTVDQRSTPAGGWHQSDFFSMWDWLTLGTANAPVRYACVTGNDVDLYMKTLSHELVEAMTDPDLKSFRAASGEEICDLCEDGPDSAGFVDGVNVSSYWSNAKTACVIPRTLPAWPALATGLPPFDGALAVGRNLAGSIDVFFAGANGEMQWLHPSGSGFGPPMPLGGSLSRNTTLNPLVNPQGSNGVFEIVALFSDDTIRHITLLSATSATMWTALPPLGRTCRSLAVCTGRDGRRVAFVVDATQTVWYTWQQAPSVWRTSTSPSTPAWTALPSFQAGNPKRTFQGAPIAAALDEDWRVRVVAMDADGKTHTTRQAFHLNAHHADTVRDDSWLPWSPVLDLAMQVTVPAGQGDPVPGLTVAPNADGRLDVFAWGTDIRNFAGTRSAWHTSTKARIPGAPVAVFAATTWDPWTRVLDPFIGSPATLRDGHGRIHVFVVDVNGQVVHFTQDAPNAATYTQREWLGGSHADAIAACERADGGIEVFTLCLEADGTQSLRRLASDAHGVWNFP